MTVARVDPVVTKSDQVRQALIDGRDIDALRIAKDFRWLGDDKEIIQRGWQAHTNPRFSKAIGRDPEETLGAALVALKKMYG